MSAPRYLPHPFGRLVLIELSLDHETDATHRRLLAELPASASPLRRVSFLAGRLALREASKAAGLGGDVWSTSRRGGPILPRGFSGSVSHKRRTRDDQLSVVAVALVAAVEPDIATIGVDLETQGPPRPEIGARILTAREREALADDGSDWPLVLGTFSIKEAIYKAIDPFLQRYVAFAEAELSGVPRTWPPEGGRFVAARLLPRSGEPVLELEAFIQTIPEASSGEGLVVSAARANLTRS